MVSIGSPPSPLVLKRQSHRKPFIFNTAGRENRLYSSGRQVTTWMTEPPPTPPPRPSAWPLCVKTKALNLTRDEFCQQHAGASRAHADEIIRISPQAYRAV